MWKQKFITSNKTAAKTILYYWKLIKKNNYIEKIVLTKPTSINLGWIIQIILFNNGYQSITKKKKSHPIFKNKIL